MGTTGRGQLRSTRHAQAQEGQGEEGSAEVARPSFGQCLHHAVASLAGDTRQIRDFQASPAAYLRRFQIDVRHPEGASALGALAELTSRRLAAGAAPDPRGEANTTDAVVVAPSTIQGEGLFTNGGLPAGAPVCDLMVGDQVSHAASKINMSKAANAVVTHSGGKMVVTTTRDLEPGEELVGEYDLVERPKNIPPPRPR